MGSSGTAWIPAFAGMTVRAGRLRLGVVAALVLLAALPARAQDLADQQILRRGNGAEPATLDPQKAEAINDRAIIIDLFEGLVTLDADNKVEPAAAASWTISPDGTVYTFKLRPGLVWSNGDPLTAADFVYAWRRAIDPATGSQYGFLYYPIKNAEDIVNGKNKDVTALGVKAPDPLTFQVTLNAPTGYFLSMLQHDNFFPVPQKAIEKFGSAWTKPGNIVSNGAFTLQEWTPQSRVVVVKNPKYREADKVKLAEVDYFPIENENEELKRYRAGELDTTDNVPVDQMDFIRSELGSEFIAPPYFGLYYVGFNTTRPPFKDAPKLRTALSLVIDREAITSKILRRGELPAYSWVPPGVPAYVSQTLPWKDKSMPERIQLAKQLYQEAGYGPDKPLQIELRYNTSQNHKKIMIAVAAMWKQALGVQVSLVNEEWKVFLETRKERKATEAYRDSWIGDYPDPYTFAELLKCDTGLNYSGWCNPAYDALLGKASAALDPAERLKLLQQAETLVLTDAPVAPLYDYVNPHLVKPYVTGFRPNLLGYTPSKDISIARH